MAGELSRHGHRGANMSRVISVATEEPGTRVTQDEVKEFIRVIFSSRRNDLERLMGVFDNPSISVRHFTEEREWYGKQHSFAERNELYIRSAVRMSAASVVKCLDAVGLSPEDISHVFFVSSTGLSTPSIDARLTNLMKFSPHVKRTPIWGLGCAGGAAGLSRTFEYTTARPGEAVLLISIELCGLTFQTDDFSKSNLVGTSLFSDGSAAALVVGDEHPLASRKGILLLDSMSTIYPDSLNVMGWEVKDSGLKVIFSKDIPTIVRDCVKPNIEEFVSRNGISLEDITHFVTHPGGLKVINAYEEALGLPEGAMRHSRKVLYEHGNMSSPTVLYVLKEFLEENAGVPAEFGIISALGPGFSSELLLFETY